RAQLLRRQIAKVCAAWLVALCLTPTTAPFSTLGAADSLAAQTDEPIIGAMLPHPAAVDLNDDALVLERATFLREAGLSALTVAGTAVPPRGGVLFPPGR